LIVVVVTHTLLVETVLQLIVSEALAAVLLLIDLVSLVQALPKLAMLHMMIPTESPQLSVLMTTLQMT
jgi:hypothetical protein